jgi:aminoglycoside phosphotransferase (APT) family kinase protein
VSAAPAKLQPSRALSAARSGPPVSLWQFIQASGLQCLVVGAARNPNAKITVLLVDGVSGRPVYAVKVPSTDTAAHAVEAEARVLVDLHELAPSVAEAVPRVVDTVDFQGRLGIVLTAVQGRPMASSYLRWRYTASYSRVAAHFAAVADWLAAFQSKSAQGATPIDLDGGVGRQIVARFGDNDELVRDLERLNEIYSNLRRCAVPRTAVHGDLWLGNILLVDGRVSGVIDWEDGAVAGEPVRDLVRFALMYALFLDRRTRPGRRVAGHRDLRAGEWGAGVAYALDGRGWFPELFRSFLGRGLERLGAASSLWRDAALAGIAEVAASTDDDEFARRHLALFRRLATAGGRNA